MKIIFVCTGNTCRSPMAAALAQSLWPEHVIISGGTNAAVGEPASPEAQQVIKQYGLSLGAHLSMPLNHHVLDEADAVITMTEAHRRGILRVRPDLSDKIFTLAELAGCEQDVSDPFGCGVPAYQSCAEQLEQMLLEIKKTGLEENIDRCRK